MSNLDTVFHCISIDLPGHGETQFPEGTKQIGLPECARGIIRFFEVKCIDACHVVGYSMGGRLALYLALHHSKRIKNIVMESGSPGLANEAEREIRRQHDAVSARRLESGNIDRFLKEWYAQPLFTTIKRRPSLFDMMFRSRLENDPSGLARSLRDMGTGAQPSLWPMLSTGYCPLLLLVGHEDKKFRDIANEISQLYPLSEVAVAKGCGHNVHLEEPDLFTETIHTFLSNRPPAGAGGRILSYKLN